jgi:hypothetical protein
MRMLLRIYVFDDLDNALLMGFQTVTNSGLSHFYQKKHEFQAFACLPKRKHRLEIRASYPVLQVICQ